MSIPQSGVAGWADSGLIERVLVYVDGFNFYNGLMSAGWGHLRWLDYHALLLRRIREGQELVALKFFTAMVNHQPEKVKRQRAYLLALEKHSGIEPIFGSFEKRDARCDKCGRWYRFHQEKRTDVAIATHLIADAYTNKFDIAYLVSADSDLVPAVEHVRSIGKRIAMIDPPKRHSNELSSLADYHWHFTKPHIRQSQLPNPVMWLDRRGKGRFVHCPEEWA